MVSNIKKLTLFIVVFSVLLPSMFFYFSCSDCEDIREFKNVDAINDSDDPGYWRVDVFPGDAFDISVQSLHGSGSYVWINFKVVDIEGFLKSTHDAGFSEIEDSKLIASRFRKISFFKSIKDGSTFYYRDGFDGHFVVVDNESKEVWLRYDTFSIKGAEKLDSQ